MNSLLSPAATKQALTALVKKLVRWERAGRYEEALEALSDDFREPDALPDVTGLDRERSAELLLRFGVLVGFYNFKHQVAGGQERSKDILTRVLSEFEALGLRDKVAECQNHIALGYWRTGELEEALVWVNESLANDLPPSSDARLYGHVTKSLILLTAKRWDENIANCLVVESDFRRYGDAFLNGSLCTNLALSFKNAGQKEEATRYLTLARIFHEKSRHKVYLGSVHNNLAQLYKEQKRFDEAHESVDAAIKIFRQLKDRIREASALDTKSQIFLFQRDLTSALAAADRSLASLTNSDNTAVIAESLLTKAKVLLLMDRFGDATLQLVEAVNITRVQNSEEAAKRLIKEFEEAINERELPPVETQSIEPGSLELLLPPNLSNYPEYRGVWINSDNLAPYGLERGSLVIVVPTPVKRGDLAAVTELESGRVICGSYDSEFGIVCIERGDDEPQLFDENKVSLLGKIIGICRGPKDADGKMIVEPIAG